MKILKLIMVALVLVLTVSVVTTSGASAATNGKVSNIKGFQNYLKEKANSDPKALDALKKFNSLSKTKQKAFVDFLNSPKYMKALSKALTMPNGKTIKVTRIDNVAVPVTLQSSSSSKEIASKLNSTENLSLAVLPQSSTTYQMTGTYTLQAFGVTTSSYSTILTYDTNGSRAIAIDDVNYTYHNINPAIWTDPQGHFNGYISGDYAYASGNWEIHSTGSLGFISDSLEVQVKSANYYYTYKKLDSSRSGWNTSWERF